MITGHQSCFKGFDGFKKTGPRCSCSRKFQPSKLSSLFWVKNGDSAFHVFGVFFSGCFFRQWDLLPSSHFHNWVFDLVCPQLLVWKIDWLFPTCEGSCMPPVWFHIYQMIVGSWQQVKCWETAPSIFGRRSLDKVFQKTFESDVSMFCGKLMGDGSWLWNPWARGWCLQFLAWVPYFWEQWTVTFLEESTAMAKSEKQKIDWSRRLWKCQIHRSEVYKAVKEKTGFNTVPFQRQKNTFDKSFKRHILCACVCNMDWAYANLERMGSLVIRAPMLCPMLCNPEVCWGFKRCSVECS